MSDIKKCWKCNWAHHMDEGESCMACGTNLCSACALDQGFCFNDIFGGTIFVCKDCVTEYKEKGMEWLKATMLEEFEGKTFLDALNEFETLQSKIMEL